MLAHAAQRRYRGREPVGMINCACCGESTPQETADDFKGKFRCPQCVMNGVMPPKSEADLGAAMLYFVGGGALAAAGVALTLFAAEGQKVFYGLIGVGVLGIGYGIYELFPD